MYSLFIRLYAALVHLVGMTGKVKARLLSQGQRAVWSQLRELCPNERRVWVHCASVGEFEQARPLLEALRADYPQFKLLVTFFSPSGYELRKNYAGADYILYLPFDTHRNVRRFISAVFPEKVYFIKYEFWRNYLRELKRRKIPFYLVSANFRPNQVFFRWYGGWYRRLLKSFTWFFVQNEASRKLLTNIGFQNVTVTGDTRFDRVCKIAAHAKTLPIAEAFVGEQPCMVAGSTWSPDEDLLLRYILHGKHRLKWIIAPHELHDERIDRLIADSGSGIRYSQAEGKNLSGYRLLVIDNIGMLSSLYRYGRLAYIGGGFGKGIHNSLEAAAFGIPVFFGPVHRKFQEALDLIETGGAFAITGYDDLAAQMDKLLDCPEALAQAGEAAGRYVASGRGATKKVIEKTC